MNNIQEWAEFYFNKGINVIPENEHFEWSDWRQKKQTIEELRGYDWTSAKDIYAVVGKKGIRILSLLRVENESVDYRDLLVERAISLLGLPYDYPWVVDYGDAICVLVESADDIQGMKNQRYRDIELLWQDTLCLPTGGSIHFYWGNIYGGLPQKRPAHISNDVLLKCFETLRKDIRGESDWPYFCGQISPESLSILDDFKYLSLVSKYDDAEKLLWGEWYMTCDTGLYRYLFKEKGDVVERSGTNWGYVINGKWSLDKQIVNKGPQKNYLHINSGLSKTYYLIYIDEKIIYALSVSDNSKAFFVRNDSVDKFKNNDDIISFFSQIENRAKLSQEASKRSVPTKGPGCLSVIGIFVFILLILLF
jgi:hypothetical protein